MEMSIPGLGSIAPEFPGFVPTNTQKIAVEAGKAQQSLSVRLLRRQSSSGLLGQLGFRGQDSEGLSSEKGLQQSEESSSDIRGHVLSQLCADHTQTPARKRLLESSELASDQLYWVNPKEHVWRLRRGFRKGKHWQEAPFHYKKNQASIGPGQMANKLDPCHNKNLYSLKFPQIFRLMVKNCEKQQERPHNQGETRETHPEMTAAWL